MKKSIADVALLTDERHLLAHLINQDGSAGPYATNFNLDYFTLPYARKIAKRADRKTLTLNGRSVLKTLTKKLNAR